MANPVDSICKPFAIRELYLPKCIREVYATDLWDPVLTSLSRLNVLIGPNNSGKSRLLRALFADTDVAYGLRDSFSEELRNHVRLVEETHRNFPTDFAEEFRNKLPKLFPQNGGDALQLGSGAISSAFHESCRSIRQEDKNKINGYRSRVEEYFRGSFAPVNIPKFKRIYIPTLRGLRPFPNATHGFAKRTKADYFSNYGDVRVWADEQSQSDPKGQIEKVNILTGGEMYEIVRSHLLGTLPMRRAMSEFQKFVGRVFYGDADFTLIPREGEDVLYAKIGKEKEQPIYNLGDGIQHMLIMMLPLFIHRDKNLLLFIEEPELYLHPGFQRILIDTILENQDVSLQVFVTTHSHQFLDITIDQSQCSVYRVSKVLKSGDDEVEAAFKVNLASSDDFSLLAELGVRNSSVMLSNCTIWVEGIWDRMYLRHYLSIWTKANQKQEYREDLHYSFVEYGGSNVTHWSFLDRDDGQPRIDVRRLCGNLLLIADRDGDTKIERHEILRDHLGDRFIPLPCREIENLLTPKTIRSVINHYEKESAAVNDFTQEEYRTEYLGDFIEKRVLPSQYQSKRSKDGNSGSYKDSSGTVKDKEAFYRHAVKSINTLDDMSADAKLLCEKIYAFIEAHNPK